MPTLFTKIIRGEIPCYKVAEDEKHFAFLDINPLMAGHTLVVPKKEADYIFDLSDDELSDLMLFSRKVALGIEKAIPCGRLGVAVVGLDVPHTHFHLVPIYGISDLIFKNPKLKLSAEEFEKIALRIGEKVIL